MIPFPPVVEPDLPGAFITKHPREGHDESALKIPFLTGLTFDEGAMKSARKQKYLLFSIDRSSLILIVKLTDIRQIN